MTTTDDGSSPLTEIERLRQENAELRDQLAAKEEAQRRVADGEARYRSLFEAIAEGVVLHGASGEILECNQAAESILGLTRDQMMGRTSMDPRWLATRADDTPFPGDEHPAMVALTTGEPVRAVTMGVHKPNGEQAWLSVNAEPMALSDGRRAVVATFTDVTALRSALMEVKAQQSRLELALGAAKVGLWEWEVGTNDIRWTDEVYAMFDIPRGTDLTLERYLARVHPDDRERLQAAIQGALEHPGGAGTYQVEHRVVLADGRVRWVRGFGQASTDEAGEPRLMRGAIADSTRQKELEERLLTSQRMESIGRLAGGVAHDFNNLLTAVIGAVDMARLDRGDDDALTDAFDTIDTACHHATQLTRQLLAFARRQALDLVPCHLDQVLEETRGLLRHLMSEDVTVDVRPGAGDWQVKVDPTQIQQVLVNLAVNARDAMPGGGTLTVTVDQLAEGSPDLWRDDVTGDWLRLRVRDTGHGMQEELLGQIFDPFFSTKDVGTGLGLATTHGIVHQVGGHLTVTSTLGEGSEFTIFLPRHRAASRPEAPPSERPISAGRGSICVVEDQTEILQVISVGLRRAGFTVHGFTAPTEALDFLRTASDTQLLLTDVVMPAMGGLELVRAISAERQDLRVIFMTGYAADSVREQLKAFPGASCLEKPFRTRDLVEHVNAALAAPSSADG